MEVEVNDLVYAHGALCERAYLQWFTEPIDAERLCTVINNFQLALKPYLTPHFSKHMSKFHVRNEGHILIVEPLGGWGAYHVS